MWVVFEPVKKREILEKIVQALPGRSKILPGSEGWRLYLRVTNRP